MRSALIGGLERELRPTDRRHRHFFAIRIGGLSTGLRIVEQPSPPRCAGRTPWKTSTTSGSQNPVFREHRFTSLSAPSVLLQHTSCPLISSQEDHGKFLLAVFE